MLKLLLGVVVEVATAMFIAGLVLAIVIPLLNGTVLATIGDTTSSSVIIGVLVAALAIALLRPGSAMRRYRKR